MSLATRAALELIYSTLLPILGAVRALDPTLYRNLNSAAVQIRRVLQKA